MAREPIKRAKRNGNGIKRGRANGSARKPRRGAGPPGALELTREGPGLGATHLRFQLASVLRVADNLVNRAVGAYDRLFALNQGQADEIYLSMGKQLAREDKLDDALEAFRKVLAAKPDHGGALYESARIHVRRGAPHAALELFQRAKSAGLRSHRLHVQFARVLGELGRHEEALSEIELALELAPEVAEHHYQRAVALDRLGRYREAVEAFEAAIARAPTEVRFHQALGFTLETLGRRNDAIRCFKRALEVERKSRDANDVLDG